jgi:hypothetical protein
MSDKNKLKETDTIVLKTPSMDTIVSYKKRGSFNYEYIRIEVCDTGDDLITVFNLSKDNINELLNNL